MKVILFHNPAAGTARGPDADQILRAIRDAGHSVTYQATDEKGAKWVLLEPADVVLVAGGDGTVRKAALAVAGRDIPLAILPLGTANNIAKTLGLTRSPMAIISQLATARRLRLDLGITTGPWGKTPFLESSGAGLLARLISHLSHQPGDPTESVESALAQLTGWLKKFPAQTWSAAIDGQTFTGKFLAMEAMNIRSVGPNLVLAPQNDPGDGQFDFVFLREEARAAFAHYLDNPQDWNDRSAPVEIVRGRHLSLQAWESTPLHADDCTWPEETQQAASPSRHAHPKPISLQIHVTDTPLEVLVPETR